MESSTMRGGSVANTSVYSFICSAAKMGREREQKSPIEHTARNIARNRSVWLAYFLTVQWTFSLDSGLCGALDTRTLARSLAISWLATATYARYSCREFSMCMCSYVVQSSTYARAQRNELVISFSSIGTQFIFGMVILYFSLCACWKNTHG